MYKKKKDSACKSMLNESYVSEITPYNLMSDYKKTLHYLEMCFMFLQQANIAHKSYGKSYF